MPASVTYHGFDSASQYIQCIIAVASAVMLALSNSAAWDSDSLAEFEIELGMRGRLAPETRPQLFFDQILDESPCVPESRRTWHR